MKNKTIQSLLKITFCSAAIIALFAAPPVALNASPKKEADEAKVEETDSAAPGKAEQERTLQSAPDAPAMGRPTCLAARRAITCQPVTDVSATWLGM